MAAKKISDLLPIPPGVSKPHAYHIFGLDEGEQDADLIRSTIRSVIRHLKSEKASADPEVWKKAAKLAQQADRILGDSAQKAALDARFGVVEIPAAAPAVDPLASLLPAADPLAAMLPAADPLAAAPVPAAPVPAQASVTPATSMPPGVFGAPAASPEPAPVVTPVSPVKVQRAKPYRRKKSWVGAIVFTGFAMSMLGLIGGLLYWLAFGPGVIAISSGSGSVTISTGTEPEAEGTAPSPTARPRRVSDGIMDPIRSGRGDDTPGESLAADLLDVTPGADQGMSGMGMPDPITPDPVDQAGPDSMPEPDVGMQPTVGMQPEPVSPTEMAPATMQPASPEPAPVPAEPTVPEPTVESIAAADVQIGVAIGSIRNANWGTMKADAERALEQAVTDSQKSSADTVYQIADLASYYRVGIQKAVEGLDVGNEIEIAPGLKVIVVETDVDLLVIRRGAKNFRYTLDEMPIKMAHSLAAFEVTINAPTGQAAGAVYQSIVPGLNEGYREQALEDLRGIEGAVEGADPKQVADALEKLIQS